MENNKSKENHKGNNRRRSKKEEKREIEKMKSLKNEESILWQYYSVAGAENTTNIVQQETSSNLNVFDNGELKMHCSFFSLAALSNR